MSTPASAGHAHRRSLRLTAAGYIRTTAPSPGSVRANRRTVVRGAARAAPLHAPAAAARRGAEAPVAGAVRAHDPELAPTARVRELDEHGQLRRAGRRPHEAPQRVAVAALGDDERHREPEVQRLARAADVPP